MLTMFIDRQVSDVSLGTLSQVTFSHNSMSFPYLEAPWLDNQPFKSCVPPGVYAGVYATSQKYGKVYHLVGGSVVLRKGDLVPTHGATRWGCIAGHGANWHQQLQGCGAFGKSLKRNHKGNGMGRSHYVGRSMLALGQVHDVLKREPVIQVIIGSDL